MHWVEDSGYNHEVSLILVSNFPRTWSKASHPSTRIISVISKITIHNCIQIFINFFYNATYFWQGLGRQLSSCKDYSCLPFLGFLINIQELIMKGACIWLVLRKYSERWGCLPLDNCTHHLWINIHGLSFWVGIIDCSIAGGGNRKLLRVNPSGSVVK